MSVDREQLQYAFGHLVGSYSTDAHAADSADLAHEVLEELLLTEHEKELIEFIAEHVAGNYTYTGEAIETERRIKAGEL